MAISITIGRREVAALGILASVVILAVDGTIPAAAALGFIGAIAAEYGYLRVHLAPRTRTAAEHTEGEER